MTYTELTTLLHDASTTPDYSTYTESHPLTPEITLHQTWELSHDMSTPHIMEVTCTDCPTWHYRYGIPLRTTENWRAGTRTPPDYLLHFITADLLSDQGSWQLTFTRLTGLLKTARSCQSEEEFILSQATHGTGKKPLKDLWELSQDFTIPTAMALTNTTRVTMHRTYGIPLRTIEDWTGRKSKPTDYILTFIATDLLAETYRD